MTQMKVLRVRELILASAFSLSLWGAFPALAGQPDAREWQRMERQVDRLTDEAGSSAIELEKRLGAIEWQQREIKEKLEVATKLGLGIMASVIGLIIQAFWGMIVSRKVAGHRSTE